MMESKITICFATIRRPHCVQRLIKSIRNKYPKIQIAVGDQSWPECTLKDFYAENDVRVKFIPHDSGVSNGRNAAIALAETEFILLVDDDFILVPQTDIRIPISILEGDSSVDIIGGLLFDVYGDLDFTKGVIRRWERMLFLDLKNELLVGLPIDSFFPIERSINGRTYFLCDAVMNWALMRSNIFQRGASWDEQYTCNGEHEDFYLNIKYNTDIKVAYSSDFIAFHHHPKDFTYLDSRERQRGWALFGKKWGVKQYYNYPLGIQNFQTDSNLYPEVKSLDEFLARSKIYRAPRNFLGIDVADNGDIFIPACTNDAFGVSAFCSNYGVIRMLEQTDQIRKVEYPVTVFRLDSIQDIRNISVKIFENQKSISVLRGDSVTYIVVVLNKGGVIGSIIKDHKIAIGIKLSQLDGSPVPFSSNHIMPLVNDLERESFQYFSFKADYPVGQYRIAIDLWVDSLGWLCREDRAMIDIVHLS